MNGDETRAYFFMLHSKCNKTQLLNKVRIGSKGLRFRIFNKILSYRKILFKNTNFFQNASITDLWFLIAESWTETNFWSWTLAQKDVPYTVQMVHNLDTNHYIYFFLLVMYTPKYTRLNIIQIIVGHFSIFLGKGERKNNYKKCKI